jgi:neurotransmitter:Na+ symporter, NSS family
LPKKQTADELNTHPAIHALWKFLVRFAAPAAIAIIFVAWVIEISL